MKSFVKKSNYNSERDSTIESDTFQIKLTSDMLKVNRIVEQIKAEDTLHSPRMFDTYGFKFVIDQKIHRRLWTK